jgi:hypothetical protein
VINGGLIKYIFGYYILPPLTIIPIFQKKKLPNKFNFLAHDMRWKDGILVAATNQKRFARDENWISVVAKLDLFNY